MKSRYERLMNIIKADCLQALIVSDGYNIDYLSGYKGHCGLMVVTAERKMILTDSRYTEQVSIEAPEFECIDITLDGYKKSLTNLFLKIIGVEDNRAVRVGFENEEISYRQYIEIDNALSEIYGHKLEFVCMDNKINALRMIKDSAELEKLARAEAIGDAAFTHIIDYIKPGMTEKQVALELEYSMRRMGASGLSFDTIAASGENSSLPHAVPTDRVLRDGDFLTMDFGCVYDGYCSDMTRTVFIGKNISDEQRFVYETVLRAQLAALEMMKPGVKCSEVDECARNIIAEAGYGEYFGHGLGHSVGLFIHEEPRCSRKCDTILEPGMMMTCEPGIYLPGRFGVRIEDLVAVTEDGYINYASSAKELLFID